MLNTLFFVSHFDLPKSVSFPAHKMSDWNSSCDMLLVLIAIKILSQKQVDEAKELLEKINANAHHIYRDADFSLLFHAVIAENTNMIEMLLEKVRHIKNQYTSSNTILFLNRVPIQLGRITMVQLSLA